MSELAEATLPTEPPSLSVVLDNEGIAWQCQLVQGDNDPSWVACIHTRENCENPYVRHPFQRGLTWGQLLVERGPVHIVHKGAA